MSQDKQPLLTSQQPVISEHQDLRLPVSNVLAANVEERFQAVERLLGDCGQLSEQSSLTFPELSIVIPVYNELRTIALVIDAVGALDIDKEIIVVDDGSSDGTRDLLLELARRRSELTVVLHEKNSGKGAALQTGFMRCRGAIVIVQDADLEYNPTDIPAVIAPIQAGLHDVVYGSRYLDNSKHTDSSWIHKIGNAALTGFSNLCTGQRLTDMETCYKAFRRELLQSMKIEQRRFGFEPEITAKLSARKVDIAEVPISYRPRSWSEGKKIGWRDLLSTLFCIFRYRFSSKS